MTFTTSALFVLVSFILSSTASEISGAQHHGVHPRDLDDTDATQYIARTGHSTIVVGNYLYIDGGEVYINDSGAVAVYPENSTYSVDLTVSWTNDSSSLPLYQTDKGGAPLLDNSALWKDGSNTSFYSYDGFLVGNSGQSTPSNQLWQFIPDGSNSGFWNESNTLSSSIFPTLQRTQGEASTSGNGVGYALGGMDPNNVPTPGLVSYNTSSGSWANVTTRGFTDSGTSMFGQLQYVPRFGPAGLLVALGGQTSGKATWVAEQNLLSFESVNIFDPASKSWASQVVSGSQPPPRTNFCSVGVQGDNGTYEIFIYGGKPQGDNSNPPSNSELQAALDLDAVYVLSLPAFNWQKASYTPARSRAWHTCNLIGSRQMVVVGGKQPWLGDSSQVTDFLAQGIGIFDLSAMEWKDEYDAGAAPYVTPDVVKTWYSEHGQYPASWSNTTVEAWFSPSSQPSSTSKVPAIAGGVGAVLGLLLLATVAWFFLRRRSKKPEGRFVLRRRSTKLDARSEVDFYKQGLGTTGAVSHDSKMAPAELNGGGPYPYKMPTAELNGGGAYPHEMTAGELNGGGAYPYKMAPPASDAGRQPMEKDGWQVHEVSDSPKYELP